VLDSGIEMPDCATKANIADALNIIIQIVRRDDCRYVSHVLEIAGIGRYDLSTERGPGARQGSLTRSPLARRLLGIPEQSKHDGFCAISVTV
jgi:hypothetical protein